MSGVWGWFGGQPAQKKKDAPKNAILALRAHLDMLQKRERHLQNQMDEQDAIARKNVNTNKNGESGLCPNASLTSGSWFWKQIIEEHEQLLTYNL
jgi:hypothetical protein